MLRFTLKQLGYFVAAGEAGSILKASENIHVSQPSISNAISQLEDTFGIQLFIRHHAQGISLTTAGREFLLEAKSLLSNAEQLHGFAGELSRQVIGSVEIGCFVPLAPIITPDLCHDFMLLHPETDIRVREANQAELLQLLSQGSIDLALTYDLHLQNNIEFLPLAKLPPYILLARTHALSGRDQLSLEEMVEEPMVLLDLPLSSEYFMSLFNKHNLKPLIKIRTRQPDVQRALVATGRGYSLANVRPINQKALDGSDLIYMKLAGDHEPLTLGIARLRDTRQTLAQESFVAHCQSVVSNSHIPGMTAIQD